MFSFTSLPILSSKRDMDAILFLCSSFYISSLVPRDHGNILVKVPAEGATYFSFPDPSRSRSALIPISPHAFVAFLHDPVHAPGSALGKPKQGAASGLENGFVITRKPGENKTMKYLHCYVRMCGYSFIEWLPYSLF